MALKKLLLEEFRLYIILDRDRCKDPLGFLRKIKREAPFILQLRNKISTDREFLALANRLREISRKDRILFIINDRIDIALASGADGAHLGQQDIDIKQARSILKSDKVIGISCHTQAEAFRAQVEGADYIGLGPIFKSKTKSELTACGLDLILETKKKISIPFFAIGGINLNNLKKVLEAGARKVAVSEAILDAQNPCQIIKEMKYLLK